MMLILLIAGWLVCAVVSYCIARAGYRRLGNEWTARDRLFFIAGGLGLGPGWVLITLVLFGFGGDPDKPAKW